MFSAASMVSYIVEIWKYFKEIMRDSDRKFLLKDRNFMHKYYLGKLLGEGRYSKVYHGRNLKTGESVAVKVMKKKILAEAKMERHVETEIRAMRTLRHPNIVQLYEVISSEKYIYIVMEYVKKGDLVTIMEETQPDEDTKRKYFQQLISAVDFCHSKGVYHRDLKPDNVLVDDNGNVKVVDFGLSAMKEKNAWEDPILFRTLCGTYGFIAPEILNREPYDGVKADIWSCGVILYYLMSGGYVPFGEEDLMPSYTQMCNREYEIPLESLGDEVGSLLFQMLDPNSNTRITIRQIMENRWFNCRDDVSCAEPKSPCVNPNASRSLSSCSVGSDDLNLFNAEQESKGALRFVSEQPVSAIASKLEEIGKSKGFSVTKDEGKVDMEATTVGGEGRLAVCGEIFESTTSLSTFEVRKTGGDTPEYERFLDQDLKPGLEDVTFGWIQ